MVPDLRYNVKITVNIKLLVPSHYMTVTGNWQTQLSTFSSKFFDREGEYLLHKFQMINQK